MVNWFRRKPLIGRKKKHKNRGRMKTHNGASLKTEVLVRGAVIILFFYTDKLPGFVRKIQKEEYWLYSYPRTPDYFPSAYLWSTITFTPLIVALITYWFTKNRVDTLQFLLGAYFSTFLAGTITNIVKLGVGRPRPDFLERCFPDGNIEDSMTCKGNPEAVIDGYKSFPSGHSSLSFSCLVFISLYIAGKLHIFSSHGRGSSWRVITSITPVLSATMIAVSRTADYHHHWQDVTVGSILGLVIAYLVYRMHYPALQRSNSHLPHVLVTHHETFISTIDHPVTPTSPSYTQKQGFENIMKLV